MTVRELRKKYLEFFQSKGHVLHPSGSLIPVDVTGRLDESLLFNGAGMVQFKPYFRGVAEPPARRLTNCQKCVRTGDIDEVGDLTHLTFFEMLGNFSFGDYFKAQAIAWSWEFITSKEWLGLDPHKVSYTVFEEDQEAYDEWAFWLVSVDIDPATRVFKLGEDTNYWPAGAFSAGPPGPCGPNSEMFYWVADEPPPSGDYTREMWVRDEAEGKWLEFWNDVFIQFEWQGHLRNPERPSDGYEKDGMPPLPFQSVDTGMGLERSATVLSGFKSLYDTDAFTPILSTLADLEEERWQEAKEDREALKRLDMPVVVVGDPVPGLRIWTPREEEYRAKARRLIADHIRSLVVARADDILPGPSGRGYVIRRLARRAVRAGAKWLLLKDNFLTRLYEPVGQNLGDVYPEILEKREAILYFLDAEETLFRRTLRTAELRIPMVLQEKYESSLAQVRPYVQDSIRDEVEIAHRNIVFGRSGEPLTNLLNLNSRLLKAKELIVQQAGLDEAQRLLEPLFRPNLMGSEAYFLYETFGYPPDLLEEMVGELFPASVVAQAASADEQASDAFAGWSVDTSDFEHALALAQERSRGASGMDTVYGGVVISIQFEEDDGKPTPTVFRGYETADTQSRIVAALPQFDESGKPTREFAVALDQTPFYAQSGGQVSDEGVLRGKDFELRVLDMIKQDGVYVHLVEPLPPSSRSAGMREGAGGGSTRPSPDFSSPKDEEGGTDPRSDVARLAPGIAKPAGASSTPLPPSSVTNQTEEGGTDPRFDLTGLDTEAAKKKLLDALMNQPVEAVVDHRRRRAIMRNHTATHLLHAALRQILGKHVTQAGSYVGPDRLRFDFTHGKAMTPDELAEVERIVNQESLENIQVETYVDIPISEAKARGAMALFGEKYGDKVRMVEVGEFSRELCGGIHVRSTGEIGLFKIISEGSAASGVRRIEAITGEIAYDWLLDETKRVRDAATLLKASPRDLVAAVERAVEQAKDEKKRREKAEMAAMGGGSSAESAANDTVEINGLKLWRKNFGEVDQKLAAQAVDNAAQGQAVQVSLAAVAGDGKVTFICKVGPEAVAKGAHAGNLLKEVAKIAGGGGGGRPDFATAGGKQPEKAGEALRAAEEILRGMLRG